MMRFTRPPQPLAPCNATLCHGRGTCQAATSPWCVCALGYDPVGACADPYMASVPPATGAGVAVAALVLYAGMALFFALEVAHMVARRGVGGALRRGGFATWAQLLSFLFLVLRIAAFALLLYQVATASAHVERAIWVVNTVGVSVWGAVFVLCTTFWLDLVERARGLGLASAGFRKCKKANLGLMGAAIPLGAACSIASATLANQQEALAPLLATAAQLLAGVGIFVPLIIACVCLVRVRPYLRAMAETDGPDAVESPKLAALQQLLLAKTRILVATIGALLLVFVWIFGATALDGAMPGVIVLKYYMIVVTDVLVVPLFWYFTQAHAHRPGARFLRGYFDPRGSARSAPAVPWLSTTSGVATTSKTTTTTTPAGATASTKNSPVASKTGSRAGSRSGSMSSK